MTLTEWTPQFTIDGIEEYFKEAGIPYVIIKKDRFDSLLERIEKLEKRVFPFKGDEKKCPY